MQNCQQKSKFVVVEKTGKIDEATLEINTGSKKQAVT
jgi:hypothetical protein